MSAFLSPVQLVQNPAFGSAILWHFARGYQQETVSKQANFELMFLVLPLILHRGSLDVLSSTQTSSGLGKFALKLAEEREDLLAVHDRALALRPLTLQSIGVGLSARIMSLDYSSGNIRSNDVKLPKPTEMTKQYVAAAEKLGRWTARVPLGQAFATLQVHP